MTPESADDTLDRLLADWARQREPSEVSQELLHHRLAQALSAEMVQDSLRATSTSRPALPAQSKSWYWAVGMTLGVLFTVGFSLIENPARNSPPQRRLRPDPFAWQSPVSLHQQATKFRELDRLFDQRVRCVTEFDHKLTIDLQEAGESSPLRQRPPLSIRVVIQFRRPGDANWSALWNIDVVSKQEQICSIPIGPDHLRLWAFRLPDGMILVESDLTLRDESGHPTTTSQLLTEGESTEVLSVNRDGVEYRMFESAVGLKG